MNRDLLPELQSHPLRRAQIDDADPGARIHQQIERLLRLGNIDLDPQQTLTKLEGKFNFGGLSRSGGKHPGEPNKQDRKKHWHRRLATGMPEREELRKMREKPGF